MPVPFGPKALVSVMVTVMVGVIALQTMQMISVPGRALRGQVGSDPNPVVRLKLNDGSGNTADDSQGSNDGTLPNNGTWSAGLPAFLPALNDTTYTPLYTLNLDSGQSQYVSIPDSDTFNLAGDFTLAIAAKFGSVNDGRAFVGHDEGAGQNIPKWIFGTNIQTAGRVQFHVNGSGLNEGVNPLSVQWTPTANVWYHFAVVRQVNGLGVSTLRLYICGNEKTNESPEGTLTIPNPGAPVTLGVAGVGDNPENLYFHGNLADFRFYNTALTEAQVRSLITGATCGEAPSVTSLSPSSGPTAEGTSVTITGTNFTSVTAVKFDTASSPFTEYTADGDSVLEAGEYRVDSATQISVKTAAHAAGTVDVTVTTPQGTSLTSGTGNDYTYVAAPTVTSISPVSGPTAGGGTITITGTNLMGATGVSVGGNAATNVTVVNSTSVTATIPEGSAGTVDVRVTTAGGQSANTDADNYTYVAAPTVTSISPPSGPTAGETIVVITGTNLTAATNVTFGGTNAAFSVNGPTQITATAPAGAAGTVDVRVTTAGGQSANTDADNYTYVAAPTVTSISPVSGPTAGGGTITITGTNLTGATGVSVGGNAATNVTVVNSTSVTATIPEGSAGTVDVRVTTAGGQSANTDADNYTYVAAPTVTSLGTTSGPATGGTSVVINGTNFTGASAVKFGSTNATSYTVNNATQITAMAPAGSVGTVTVSVTTTGGTSANNGTNDDFIYYGAPTVTALSPSSGPVAGGTTVVITGTNFTGATPVAFGSSTLTLDGDGGSPEAGEFKIDSATQITAIAPAKASGTVQVLVTNAVGTSSDEGAGNDYRYIGTPTILSISPSTGPMSGGTQVTITGQAGSDLDTTETVYFDETSVDGAAIQVVSSTSIYVTTPAHAADTVDIIVQTDGGSVESENAFTFCAAPVITSFSPAYAAMAAGDKVSIVGSGFDRVAGVTVGGTVASIDSNGRSDTRMTITVPATANPETDIAPLSSTVLLTSTCGSASRSLARHRCGDGKETEPEECDTPNKGAHNDRCNPNCTLRRGGGGTDGTDGTATFGVDPRSSSSSSSQPIVDCCNTLDGDAEPNVPADKCKEPHHVLLLRPEAVCPKKDFCSRTFVAPVRWNDQLTTKCYDPIDLKKHHAACTENPLSAAYNSFAVKVEYENALINGRIMRISTVCVVDKKTGKCIESLKFPTCDLYRKVQSDSGPQNNPSLII